MAMPEEHGAGAQGEEPPPPPPPPPIATSFDLWDWFGDPGELRAAATAWEAIATHLEGIERRLGATVRASGAEWSGAAHDAFRAHWDAMGPELGTGADGMREVATQLRSMADELEAKNDLIQSIYVMVAATAAVSVISGLVTFGVGAAVGAASVAANVVKAERVLAAVKAFVVASRVAMAAVKATKIGAFSLRFAGFAAQGTIATAAVKQVALDQDPFDANNWSTADVAGVVLGGGGSAALGLRGATLAGTLPRTLASGFAADAGTSVLVDLVGGNARPGQIVTNALLSGTTGSAFDRGALRTVSRTMPGLRAAEKATAARLVMLPGFAKRKFTASTHPGAEYVDDLGRSYDAVGMPQASKHWNEAQFLRSIDAHLTKDNAFTVIDLTGFTGKQIDAVRQHLKNPPANARSEVIRIGF